jgi:hypothetical protein
LYAVSKPRLAVNACPSCSQPSGQALPTSPITYPPARASPRQECVALCSTSCFSFPSYAYLTPRYSPAAPPPFINPTNTIKVQYFFAFKSVIAPIIFLAVFGDTLRRAGGTISHSTVITQGTTVSGSALAWAFFASK